ncbi:unnamed protein product [Calypogeia fissa]
MTDTGLEHVEVPQIKKGMMVFTLRSHCSISAKQGSEESPLLCTTPFSATDAETQKEGIQGLYVENQKEGDRSTELDWHEREDDPQEIGGSPIIFKDGQMPESWQFGSFQQEYKGIVGILLFQPGHTIRRKM